MPKEDRSWLPSGRHPDALKWPMIEIERAQRDQPWVCPLGGRCHITRVQATDAYEIGHATDGRLVHIRWWRDGDCRQVWCRHPMDGTWPGTYAWVAARDDEVYRSVLEGAASAIEAFVGTGDRRS